MTVNAVDVGFQALYALLSGDVTFMSYITAIGQNSVPPGTLPDYCLLINQSAQDTLSATAVRIMSRPLFQVKVLGPIQDDSNIRAAYARADAILQPSGQPLRNSNSTLAIYRESELPTDGGTINGVQWLVAGGIYRVEVG